MSNQSSSPEFDSAMRDIYDQASKLGYRPTYFLRMLSEHGPRETANRLLDARDVSEGFTRLFELGRLDLSVEAVVLRPEFRHLFTGEQLKAAEDRLASMDYKARETTVDRIDSDKAPEPVGAYPHARRVGNLLFLSGVGPRTRGSNEIPGVTLDNNGNMTDYDIAAQCRSCFDNIRAVLDAAGSSWDNIIDVLVFLTDMKRDFEAYNRVYAEFFAGDDKPNPARTTIEISRLPQGGNAPIAIELKVIATIE